MKNENTAKFLSGFAAIVGRPNVGKSTMMNAMVGEKVAIVSNRPQTTRNRIMGVATDKDWQIVFLDTPGLHKPRTRLGEYMVKSVQDAMDGIDVLLVLVDANEIGPQDRTIVEEMSARRGGLRRDRAHQRAHGQGHGRAEKADRFLSAGRAEIFSG